MKEGEEGCISQRVHSFQPCLNSQEWYHEKRMLSLSFPFESFLPSSRIKLVAMWRDSSGVQGQSPHPLCHLAGQGHTGARRGRASPWRWGSPAVVAQGGLAASRDVGALLSRSLSCLSVPWPDPRVAVNSPSGERTGRPVPARSAKRTSGGTAQLN